MSDSSQTPSQICFHENSDASQGCLEWVAHCPELPELANSDGTPNNILNYEDKCGNIVQVLSRKDCYDSGIAVGLMKSSCRLTTGIKLSTPAVFNPEAALEDNPVPVKSNNIINFLKDKSKAVIAITPVGKEQAAEDLINKVGNWKGLERFIIAKFDDENANIYSQLKKLLGKDAAQNIIESHDVRIIIKANNELNTYTPDEILYNNEETVRFQNEKEEICPKLPAEKKREKCVRGYANKIALIRNDIKKEHSAATTEATQKKDEAVAEANKKKAEAVAKADKEKEKEVYLRMSDWEMKEENLRKNDILKTWQPVLEVGAFLGSLKNETLNDTTFRMGLRTALGVRFDPPAPIVTSLSGGTSFTSVGGEMQQHIYTVEGSWFLGFKPAWAKAIGGGLRVYNHWLKGNDLNGLNGLPKRAAGIMPFGRLELFNAFDVGGFFELGYELNEPNGIIGRGGVIIPL